MRTGLWLPTRSGKQFYPLDPQVSDIDISDISIGLSNECRFGGQIEFYCVGQHVVHTSQVLAEWGACALLQLHGLLHDASEAYLKDLPRSLKGLLSEYKGIETRTMEVIYQSLGLPLPTEEEHRFVKQADNLMAFTEWRDFVNAPAKPGPCWHRRIHSWSPEVAQSEFNERFSQLMRRVGCINP